MEKFIVNGGKRLSGTVSVSGAKNMVLKALVAACLTDQEVVIKNIPLISDLTVMTDIIKELGGSVAISDHTVKIRMKDIKKHRISLDKAAEIRTSSLFLAPLLARLKRAEVPNPGGCRIGARPIDRTIEGLEKMNINIVYNSNDGYFHAKTEKIKGVQYRFEKNTHTGTETLLLASVLGEGRTVLENAALEPEVDDLILLLNQMGARIKRSEPRTIVIDGVGALSGTTFSVGPDRNEIVTLAIAAIMTEGDILIKGAESKSLISFLDVLDAAKARYEITDEGIRFKGGVALSATNVATSVHPGFMTDWQAPWAVLMTKAEGVSTIHETVYEQRFSYVDELRKMGAKLSLYQPEVKNPKEVYNFNLTDDKKENKHGLQIYGPIKLHNGVVTMTDLRAGATLVLAALAAKGESVIFGVEHLDRGYENFEKRLRSLGADIRREKA